MQGRIAIAYYALNISLPGLSEKMRGDLGTWGIIISLSPYFPTSLFTTVNFAHLSSCFLSFYPFPSLENHAREDYQPIAIWARKSHQLHSVNLICLQA